MTKPEIQRDRVEAIGRAAMDAIKRNYEAGPSSRDRVWEALNGCAFAAGMVIVGTGDRTGRREARRFFDAALDQVIKDMLAMSA